MEGVGPELRSESGTSENRAESFGDSAMRSFDRGVLMRRGRSGWFDTISSVFEEAANLFATAKFATKIESDILVRDGVGKAMAFQPSL